MFFLLRNRKDNRLDFSNQEIKHHDNFLPVFLVGSCKILQREKFCICGGFCIFLLLFYVGIQSYRTIDDVEGFFFSLEVTLSSELIFVGRGFAFCSKMH